jgi:truncated hemoglobin YjbI
VASPTPPLPDLRDEDIHDLLVTFYDRVERDPLLAPYFADYDMPENITRIATFWSTMLFHTGTYTGNAFRPHLEMPGLTPDHFAHWRMEHAAAVRPDAARRVPRAALGRGARRQARPQTSPYSSSPSTIVVRRM